MLGPPRAGLDVGHDGSPDPAGTGTVLASVLVSTVIPARVR
jgi:hypothetical protein